MMGRQQRRGFTIIELVLVLAISGAMLVGILATAGTAITVQRYKDSVNSAVDYFQGQYNLVTNVRNSRGNPGVCDVTGGIVQSTTTTSRGQSNCVVVGQVLRGQDGQIWSKALYATKIVDTSTDIVSDIQNAGIIENTNPNAIDTYTLEWGATLKNAGSASNGFAIAIVRSPVSGLITTFVNQTGSSLSLTEILTARNANTDAKFCVIPSGNITSVASEALGVAIARGTSNSSGVKQINSGEGC